MVKNDSWIAGIPTAPKIKKYSQAGEEGYLKFILDNVGPGEKKFFVDIGAGDGYNLSNTRVFKEHYNYQGLFIDGNPRGTVDVHKHWITRENIVETLTSHNAPKEFSLLSLDLDGNDYDILEVILKVYTPRVIIAEINGTIPAGISIKIKYNPDHTWKERGYYGFSFSAAEKLADKTGYKMVFQSDAMNVYFVRKDLLADPGKVAPVKFVSQPYHSHDPLETGEWEEVI